MFNSTGNHLTSQAVFSILEETISPTDISYFQNHFGIPQQGISASYNGYVDDKACFYSDEHCTEASLDFEYLRIFQLCHTTICMTII